jgi:hypothetical protein
MSNTRNESNHLPKGKKKSPLGKWFFLKLLSLNNFAVGKGRNKDLLLTTVSNHIDYSQVFSSGQNAEECDPSPGLRVNCDTMLSKEQKDERSVASKADSSNAAWSIKIFLN